MIAYKHKTKNFYQDFPIPKDLTDWDVIEYEDVSELVNEPVEYTYEELLRDCIVKRKEAYKESDSYRNELIYDNDPQADKKWRDKVKEIKERYPKPVEV